MSRYKFRGYTITNCGYHQPDHCVWWEAVNDNGEACFHGNTLREVEFDILDYEWEQKMKKKDEEIETLKHEKSDAIRNTPFGNLATMRDALVKTLDVIKSLSRTHNDDLPEDVRAILGRIAFEANEALSTPLRNCEVDTVDEQFKFEEMMRKSEEEKKKAEYEIYLKLKEKYEQDGLKH